MAETNVDAQTPPSPHTVYELGLGEEPSPLAWLVEGIQPEGHLTFLSGDGGLGKSYVALYIAHCVLLGRPFLGRAVKQGSVLWVDAEGMGRDELERRHFEVARGMGLERPPKRLFYYHPPSGISDAHVQGSIRGAVRDKSIALVILDSFSMGAAGSDVSSQHDTVGLLQQLRGWGSCLLLDHIPKSASQGDQAQATIFGSVFKRNGARSALKLVGREGDVRELLHDKSNFGPNSGGIRYEMLFDEDDDEKRVVRFRNLGSFTPEVTRTKRSKYVTLDLLLHLSEEGDPVSIDELAEGRDLVPKTIRNHLGELVSEGKAESCGDGLWAPVVTEEDESSASDPPEIQEAAPFTKP